MKKYYAFIIVFCATLLGFLAAPGTAFAQGNIILTARLSVNPTDGMALFKLYVRNSTFDPVDLSGGGTFIFNVDDTHFTDIGGCQALGPGFNGGGNPAGASFSAEISSGPVLQGGEELLFFTFCARPIDCNTFSYSNSWDVTSTAGAVTIDQMLVEPANGFLARVQITPEPNISITGGGFNFPQSGLHICYDTPLTISLSGNFSIFSPGYTFYHRNQSGTPPIDLPTVGGTVSGTASALGIIGNDFIGVNLIGPAGCVYTYELGPLKVDTASPEPKPVLPDTLNYTNICIGTADTIPTSVYALIPNGIDDAYDHVWQVIDENGDSLTTPIFAANDGEHNRAIIRIRKPYAGTLARNPAYARMRIIVKGVNACGSQFSHPHVWNVNLYPRKPDKPTAPVASSLAYVSPAVTTDTAGWFWQVPDTTLYAHRYSWTIEPDSAVRNWTTTNVQLPGAPRPGAVGDVPVYNITGLNGRLDTSTLHNDTLTMNDYRAWRRKAGFITNTKKVTIQWNRFYQQPSAVIKLVAYNACGASDTTYYTVNFRNMPGKPVKPRFVSSAGRTGDTVCSNRSTNHVDSTAFITDHDIPAPSGPVADSARFAWFATPFPNSIPNQYNWFYSGFEPAVVGGSPARGAAVSQGQGAQRIPILLETPANLAQFNKLIQTTTDSVHLKWNPNFYGWVRIQVAARSSYQTRKMGIPYYYFQAYPKAEFNIFGLTTSPATGIGAPGSVQPSSDLGALSDYMTIFIRPRPLKPSKPKGSKSWYRTGTDLASYSFRTYSNGTRYSTLTTLKTGSRYAKSHVWLVKNASGVVVGKSDGSITTPIVDVNIIARINGLYQPSDSLGRACELVWKPEAPLGMYFLSVYGVNDCGVGDTSAPLRILLTDTVPGVAGPIHGYPHRILPSTSTDSLSLCMNPGEVFYSTSANHTIEYIWRLENVVNNCGPITAIAGTIFRDSLATPGHLGPDAEYSDSAIGIRWDPNFCGTVRLIARPINAGSNNTAIPPDTIKAETSVLIHIFRRPIVFVGVGGGTQLTAAPITVPVGVEYKIGGAPGVITQQRYIDAGLVPATDVIPPTATGGEPFTSPSRADYDIDWHAAQVYTTATVNVGPGQTTQGNLPTKKNPVFKADAAGTYTFSIRVSDSSGCAPQFTDTMIIFNAVDTWNIKVDKLWLNSSFRDAANPDMNFVLPYLTSKNSSVPRTGPLQQNFERISRTPVTPEQIVEPGHSELMFPGYQIPEGAVDYVKFSLRTAVTDDISNKSTGTTAPYAYGWLMRDGSVLDFETVTSPTLRFYRTPAVTSPTYYVVARHRNHLPAMTADKVTLRQNYTFGDDPISTTNGVTSFAVPSLIYREANLYNRSVNYRGLIKENSVWTLPAGNVTGIIDPSLVGGSDDRVNEVNASDYSLFLRKFYTDNLNGAIKFNQYDDADVNMDGILDLGSDLSYFHLSDYKVYYSTAP
ncbi:MAG: hypothetical protein V4543_08150 [Bacteroidota bacterium]